MTAEDQKRLCGEAAAELVQSGMTVGLGTGTTAAWLVKALAKRKLDIVCVPTSEATAKLAGELGIRLITLDEARTIDLTIDGADEVGPGLSLIKGGGGELLREKLVWEASRRCVCIVDAAKQVSRLGKFPLPIEVIAFGHAKTHARICDVLTEYEMTMPPRMRMKDGAAFRTDSGNLIYDAACGAILEPALLAEALKSITGVVDHGLFLDLADEALVGTDEGVVRILP